MKRCPICGGDNADDHKFCLRCGRAFNDAPPADLTLNWVGSLPVRRSVPVDVFTAGDTGPARVVRVDDLFAANRRLVIGRSPTCDIYLPHPSISRRHALLERLPEGIRLFDLRSVNGVLVGGRRITEPVFIREQERIGIGPYLFCLDGGLLHALDSSQSLRLEARNLEKIVSVGRRTRSLLANVNLAIEPGEFVSLLGPSGSGKSTLMDCLNGRRPATRGRVLANGEDFYLHFDSFRQLLGYVPQRDIVHTQLSVYKALYYTARLRLPADTDPDELHARIAEVLRLMELLPHQETPVGNLSGGQVKRVSLGAELIARPCLLYIDEATSGLDAGTEARMMRLFRQLSREGKSILCITHNVDNVDLCDLILVLTTGRLVFYGPPAEGRTYFGVGRVGEIYDRLAEKPPEEWEKQFQACSLHREFVERRLEIVTPGSMLSQVSLAPAPRSSTPSAAPAPPQPQRERPHRQFLHQLVVLTVRYAELLWRDPRTLRLLLLQAPIVAAIILLSFVGKPFQYEMLTARPLTAEEHELLSQWLTRLEQVESSQLSVQASIAQVAQMARNPREAEEFQQLLGKLPIPETSVREVRDKGQLLLATNGPLMPDRLIVDPTYTYILLCLLVITVLWFGCNNASKEIVKEEPIYARERSVNLGITSYLASKFTVLGVISALQLVVTMAVIYGGLEVMHQLRGDDVPPALYRLNLVPQYGVLLLLALSGVALGLLLSACVGSPDRAATLLPYVLIPQIVLSGGLLPIDAEPMRTLALVASPAYWAYRAVRTGETELPPEFPWHADYDDHLWLPCVALAAQTAALLLLTAWFLRRKDVRRG